MKPLALLPAMLLLCASVTAAQEAYSGPRPPKPDVPYLMHADNLLETETAEAREQKRGKDDVAYIVAGAASPVRTPLAEPIFLFESDKIAPESLGLFRMEVRGGNREVVVSQKQKRNARPLRLMVTRIEGRLYRVEVNEGLGLENGEYSLSPQGSNTAFCFAVY
ncbi:MAG TPA: hypothetical protein VF767_05515 [Bryobacteraceae bacterium]